MQEQVTTKKLDDILRKVQGLLAKADHPNTGPEEAAAFRDKAEAMMFTYRIDEAMLAEAQPVGERTLPQWRTIRICRSGNEFGGYYRKIYKDALLHTDCRGNVRTERIFDEEAGLDEWWIVGETVGYDAELRYAEMLYTSCQLAFQQRLEPRFDPDESEQVNAYRMRKAGMEGRRIAMLIYGKDDKHLRPKVRKMFEAEAKLRGEDPTALLGKGNDVKNYRQWYAAGFVDTIATRLSVMRQSRGEDTRGLVLASRKEHVNEAYYLRFPDQRPKETFGGQEANPWVDPTKNCPKCQRAKSGYCRDHGYLKPRMPRGKGPTVRYDAIDAGRDAARTVDLGPGGKGKVEHNEPKGEL